MWEVLAVGGVAAGSVFIGMPLARSPRVTAGFRLGLTSGTVGILLFLFVDLFTAGNQQVFSAQSAGAGSASILAAVLGAGFVIGFAVLPLATTFLARAAPAPKLLLAPRQPFTSGAGALGLAPFQLSLLTAIGIGMHNFAEGLAIGSTYAAGVVALSILLAIGVIAHKSSEGFCICGCASNAARSFSTPQLGLLGLVGGGPTLAGVLVGGVAGSFAPASIFVFGLAGGALISVVLMIYDTQLRGASQRIMTVGIATGFLVAFAADFALALTGF